MSSLENQTADQSDKDDNQGDNLGIDFSYACEYTDNLPAILKELNMSLAFTSYQSSRLMLLRSDGEKIDVNYKHFPRPMGLVSSELGLTLGTFSQIINFHREDGLLEQIKRPLQPIEEDVTAPKVDEQQGAPTPSDPLDDLLPEPSEELSELELAARELIRSQVEKQRTKQKAYQDERMAAVDSHVDACFITRSSHYSGMINLHDIDWGDAGLWVVNSSFSCLCTLEPDYSFVPRWKPHFISELVPEDRCHLNGMALKDGKPAYVTTFSQYDAVSEWRNSDSNTTGTLMDVATNTVLVDGLVMPHSPRWHKGKVYYCNSGLGHVCSYDPADGKQDVIAELAGFTRGMTFYDDILIVGTSKLREGNVRHDTPLARSNVETMAGLTLINLKDNNVIANLTFTGDVEQIYDVAILHGCHYPELIEPAHPRMRNHFTHPQLQPLV